MLVLRRCPIQPPGTSNRLRCIGAHTVTQTASVLQCPVYKLCLHQSPVLAHPAILAVLPYSSPRGHHISGLVPGSISCAPPRAKKCPPKEDATSHLGRSLPLRIHLLSHSDPRCPLPPRAPPDRPFLRTHIARPHCGSPRGQDGITNLYITCIYDKGRGERERESAARKVSESSLKTHCV